MDRRNIENPKRVPVPHDARLRIRHAPVRRADERLNGDGPVEIAELKSQDDDIGLPCQHVLLDLEVRLVDRVSAYPEVENLELTSGVLFQEMPPRVLERNLVAEHKGVSNDGDAGLG